MPMKNALFLPFLLVLSYMLTNSVNCQDSVAIAPDSTPVVDRAVVLLGEIPVFTGWEDNSTSPEYLLLAESSFPGARVIDMLTTAAIANRLPDLPTTVSQMADLTVIVLVGRSDTRIKSPDAEVQSALEKKLRSYAGSNRRIYLLPSDSQLPIQQTGNLRMAASNAGATYLTLAGNEPLSEAFREIAGLKLSDTAVMPVETQGEQAPQTLAVPDGLTTDVAIERVEPIEIPSGLNDSVPVRRTPISGASEVSRIAGMSDEEAQTLQTSSTAMLDSLPPIDAPEAISREGKLVKRGSEAKETINMKPMPAVKAYRPARPVQRKNINKKEPDVSR